MKEMVSVPKSTRLISFDLWLTLIKSDGKTFKNLRNELIRQRFAPDVDFESFNEIVREQDKASDRIAESRGNDVMFAERLAMIAQAVSAQPPTQTDIAELYKIQTDLLMQHSPVLLDPDTPDLLAELTRDSRQLAVVSNTGFIHGQEMRAVLAHLGIAQKMSHLVFSNEVGYAKPHPKIYEALLDEAGVGAGDVTHIGDNYHADVEGARKMGMNAIHLAGNVTLRSIVQQS